LENHTNRKNGKEKVGKHAALEESLLVIRYWLMEKNRHQTRRLQQVSLANNK
jgi:hypothetical protein